MMVPDILPDPSESLVFIGRMALSTSAVADVL